MGFKIKFNWVLQIDSPEIVELNQQYSFCKRGNRVFPIDTPIDLIDNKRNAIAKIQIQSFKNETNKTSGSFRVIKVYEGSEKAMLTSYWHENQ